MKSAKMCTSLTVSNHGSHQQASVAEDAATSDQQPTSPVEVPATVSDQVFEQQASVAEDAATSDQQPTSPVEVPATVSDQVFEQQPSDHCVNSTESHEEVATG